MAEANDHLFLRACRRQPVERTPIWMMRQAGRYLPSYRAVRARASFLEMCRTPELACEVTLQPIDKLVVPDPTSALSATLEAVRQIKSGLAGRVPLIGFAGAPLTMLTYAVEGGGSKDYPHTKKLLYGAPRDAHALLDKLARTCAVFLEAQVAAGADAVQIFDSWGGIVSPGDFREYPLRYAKRVIEMLRASPTWKAR